jgi:hypothetical protein
MSITCGEETPREIDGVGISATEVGIPARLATSTTFSSPALIPSGT